ncbi:hypothetical protein ACFWHG_30570 [Streptomyces microflavus]|uniref:hypothetical protein n=1 Tax=Streptomyces microflavus TaxID=1919 RepID=UPI003659B1FD
MKAAATEAQKAYDKAAKRASEDAANTKTNAVQAVTDAKTALGTLPENAMEEEKGSAAPRSPRPRRPRRQPPPPR